MITMITISIHYAKGRVMDNPMFALGIAGDAILELLLATAVIIGKFYSG